MEREALDRDFLTEQMNVSVFGMENPGFFPSDMTKPGYLATLNDPTFGTPITRIFFGVVPATTFPKTSPVRRFGSLR